MSLNSHLEIKHLKCSLYLLVEVIYKLFRLITANCKVDFAVERLVCSLGFFFVVTQAYVHYIIYRFLTLNEFE